MLVYMKSSPEQIVFSMKIKSRTRSWIQVAQKLQKQFLSLYYYSSQTYNHLNFRNVFIRKKLFETIMNLR